MAIVRANNAEGGTAGTTVTVANSGGMSGDAFSRTWSPAGSTVQFDNAHVRRGTLAYKLASGTATALYGLQLGGLAAQTSYWSRAYFYFTAIPAALWALINFDFGTTYRAGVGISSTGKMALISNTGAAVNTGATTFALNQWVRIEARIVGSTTVGQLECKLFNDAEATVPVETLTSAATLNTGGVVDSAAVGDAGVTNEGPYWMSDFTMDDAGYPGPAVQQRPYLRRQAVNRSSAF